MMYHWNVLDAKTRFLLASHLSVHRDLPAAIHVFRKALAKADHPPKRVVTDKQPSYPAAIRIVVPNAKHIPSKGVDHPYLNNNLSERMQGTFRSREKTLRGMDSVESGQRYLDGFTITYNYFRDHSAIEAKTPALAAKIVTPFSEWTDIVKADVVVPPEARTIHRTRTSSLERLPRDLTERKRIQRRMRREARKAEIIANKKKDKPIDDTVPMMNTKTLKPSAEFKHIQRKMESEYGKSGKLRKSLAKLTPPKPLMPEFQFHREAPKPQQLGPVGKPKIPTPVLRRPRTPPSRQPKLL